VVELTVLPSNLVLGNNDLCRIGIICARDRVLENTNRPNDLSSLDNSDFSTFIHIFTSTKVRRISDNSLGSDCLSGRSDSGEFPVFANVYGFNLSVEHVGSSVDCRETGKGLREFTQSVEWVDVG
jgi:hypothetical protein